VPRAERETLLSLKRHDERWRRRYRVRIGGRGTPLAHRRRGGRKRQTDRGPPVGNRRWLSIRRTHGGGTLTTVYRAFDVERERSGLRFWIWKAAMRRVERERLLDSARLDTRPQIGRASRQVSSSHRPRRERQTSIWPRSDHRTDLREKLTAQPARDHDRSAARLEDVAEAGSRPARSGRRAPMI